MPIVNKGKEHGPVCDMMREAFGHRAAWLYLLLDEAKNADTTWKNLPAPPYDAWGMSMAGSVSVRKRATTSSSFPKNLPRKFHAAL